jgi:hypothetical protein
MLRFLLAAAALGFASATAPAQPILIDVYPSIGPNSATSPSYPGYAANAATGVGAGGQDTGTPGTPTFYTATSNPGTVSALNILATGFPSWQGTVNPAAPFDAERGNQVYFGVRLRDPTGNGFSLSNLSYQITDTLNDSLSSNGSYATADYSTSWVGVINGPDGPTFITSGPSTQRVTELWGVGAATGVPISDVGSLASTVNNLPGFSITATYTLLALDREELEFQGSGTVSVEPAQLSGGTVPAPPGLWLGLIAAVCGAATRRRCIVNRSAAPRG